MAEVLLAGTSRVIDGSHCVVIHPGLISFQPILKPGIGHRYVLFAHKRDAARFSQLREREGALCSYYELESGGWLCSWYYQTKFVVIDASALGGQHYRRIVVAKVILGTEYNTIRKLNSGYWGVLYIRKEWKVRENTSVLDAYELCERLNNEENLP